MNAKEFLFIINDASYGNERSYSAMRRYVMNLVKSDKVST